MSRLRELEARKQLLLAQSSLARLRIQRDLAAVRDSVSWMDVGLRAVTAQPVRSAVFGLLVSRLGHNRLARGLAVASKILLAARLTGIAVDLRRAWRAHRQALPDAVTDDSRH